MIIVLPFIVFIIHIYQFVATRFVEFIKEEDERC